MEKLQITKGEWRIENKSANGIVEREDAIAITVDNDFNWDVCCIWNDIEEGMAEANAILIIDAGNTYQQCETLSSELLRQNREMKEALKEIVKVCDELGHHSIQLLAEYCLTSLNKDKE